jgi:MoxR-like ATPase
MAITLEKGQALMKDIIAEVSRVVIGKDDTKELLLIALLSRGHVLIEGLRGTAKTTVARTFARVIGGTFKRVQGTPDMLPSDILGFNLYRADGTSKFMPGPIFTNVLLADELNRTTPRTQSALLEVMQEQQVTIEGETRQLEQPFVVIASQIPYGGPGTSQLSEVQTDRFMFRIWSGLASPEEEDRILKDIDAINEPQIKAVTEPADILRLQQEVKKVFVADSVRRYIVDIVDKLRHHPDLTQPPSTRASIALYNGARARAFFQARDFVIPDDVKALLVPVLCHRIQMSSEAEMDNLDTTSIINETAAQVPVPKLEHE